MDKPNTAPKTETPVAPLHTLHRNINAYWDELASYENAMYERAKSATADLAGMAQESIAYVAALSAEWRRMSLEVTRRAVDTITKAV